MRSTPAGSLDEHLLGLGHTEIGLIGPASDLWAFRMRERGFVQSVRAAGLRVASDHLRRSPATVSGGHAAMRGLLASRGRPTAVFCTNDLIALGAMKACIEAGVAVPDAMSICGCDDIETARLVTPELTTVHVRAREMGARAARTLIRLVEARRSARAVDERLRNRSVCDWLRAEARRRQAVGQRRDNEIDDDGDGARIDSACDAAVHSTDAWRHHARDDSPPTRSSDAGVDRWSGDDGRAAV